MRMTNLVIAAIASVVCLASVPADAGPRSTAARQHRQHQRIAARVADGSLTPAEARRLRAGQAHIRAEARRYRRSGGGLSGWERADLQRDLNRQSRKIRRHQM